MIPLIGTLIFLLIGTRRLGSRRSKHNKAIQHNIPQNISEHIQDSRLQIANVDTKYNSISHIAETIGGSHVLNGNQAMLFGDSDKMINSLAADIQKATKQCHILSYIMLNDEAGQYSFWDYQAGCWPQNKGIRIDHFLVSPAIADKVTACRIDAGPRAWEKPSDHTPVLLEFEDVIL